MEFLIACILNFVASYKRCNLALAHLFPPFPSSLFAVFTQHDDECVILISLFLYFLLVVFVPFHLDFSNPSPWIGLILPFPPHPHLHPLGTLAATQASRTSLGHAGPLVKAELPDAVCGIDRKQRHRKSLLSNPAPCLSDFLSGSGQWERGWEKERWRDWITWTPFRTQHGRVLSVAVWKLDKHYIGIHFYFDVFIVSNGFDCVSNGYRGGTGNESRMIPFSLCTLEE